MMIIISIMQLDVLLRNKDAKHWWILKAVIDKFSDENLIFNTFKDDVAWKVRLAESLNNK